MCLGGGGGGGRPLFVPTPLTPVAPPLPPDAIDLQGIPQMAVGQMLGQSRAKTQAERRRGVGTRRLGSRRMMTIPKSNY